MFLTSLLVFSDHLSLLTSPKFLTLSVLTLSVQLPQLFGTPFRTQSAHLIQSIHSAIHFLCTHFWQLVHCNELLPTPLLQTQHGHLTAFCLTF